MNRFGQRFSMAQATSALTHSDWLAATDVTPEHTGERTGADKALAAVAGSKLLIAKAKALLANEKQLDDATARQLHKLLLGAAENPGTIPEVVARRVEADWVRSIRNQCADAGVSFFFKQWGGRTPKAGGRELEGRIHDELEAIICGVS